MYRIKIKKKFIEFDQAVIKLNLKRIDANKTNDLIESDWWCLSRYSKKNWSQKLCKTFDARNASYQNDI